MRTKLTTILLLTTFLISGCKNQKFICAEIKSARVAPVAMYDVSFVFNRCRVRCFDVNKWETLPLNSCPQLTPPEYEDFLVENNEDELKKLGLKGSAEAVNLDINDCEGVIGFKVDSIANELRPKIKRLHSLKVDSCGQ